MSLNVNNNTTTPHGALHKATDTLADRAIFARPPVELGRLSMSALHLTNMEGMSDEEKDVYISLTKKPNAPSLESLVRNEVFGYNAPKYTADFFGVSPDFIMKEAQNYAKIGGDNALYKHIDALFESDSKLAHSINAFAKSALDFFSVGNYTQADLDKTKTSVENIIKELAEMLRNGDEADFSKLQNKVDIMGEQLSLTDLFELQKYGKELTDQLMAPNDKGWLGFGNDRVGEFARRGLIKSMGMAFGDRIGGTMGEMFKSAWGAEVDRHSEIIMNGLDDALQGEEHTTFLSILKGGAKSVYDVFTKIDTSSKESAFESFKALSREIDAVINKFTAQFAPISPGFAAKLRNDVNTYFYDLMGFKSVDLHE